jgi:hypothetical protein
LDPNTELGNRLVHRWLVQQILPVCAVILLSSVFENKSARRWVELEVDLARLHRKPVIGVPAFGRDAMASEAHALADAVCAWNARQIISEVNARASV